MTEQTTVHGNRAETRPAGLHLFDLAELQASAWKNGGGSTREIVCWPPGSTIDNFEWRASVANVEQSGQFSRFPGVDRQIMLLAGDGFHLTSEVAGINQAMRQPLQPFKFNGDPKVHCEVLGGPVTDFNIMYRRESWACVTQIEHTAQVIGKSPAGLLLVAEGQWQLGERVLEPGQGLWWGKPIDAQPLHELRPAGADARLIHVRLESSWNFV